MIQAAYIKFVQQFDLLRRQLRLFAGTSKLSHTACVYTQNTYTQCFYKWQAFTHTLIRNIIANFCCGMHLTCKNIPVKPNRKNWLTEREIHCEEFFQRPCSKEGSDAAFSVVKNRRINRLWQQCRNEVETKSTCRFWA